jgi:hypothetical protein
LRLTEPPRASIRLAVPNLSPSGAPMPSPRRRPARCRCAFPLAALLAALPAAAAPIPDHLAFPIADVTLAPFEGPRVAVGADGGLAVLWVGECPELAVCLRTWGPDGAPVAGPVALEVPVADLDGVPALAAAAGGDFWVAWTRPGLGFAREVAMRRFAPSGAGVGLERFVAAAAGQVLAAPAVGADALGQPVVVWERRRFEATIDGQPVFVGVEVQGRRFGAGGVALGDSFRVDTADGELVAAPAVAVAADGGFLVAWESFGFDADEDDVLARRFAPGLDGGAAPQGPPEQVHPSGGGRQIRPAAAASGPGTFLVAFEAPGLGGQGRRVFAQVYGAGGALWPAPFGLGVATGDQTRPAAAGGAGAFVVAWEDAAEGGSLRAQRRDPLGAPLEEAFRVDSAAGTPRLPALAVLPGGGSGGLFAAWTGIAPAGSRTLYGRRYSSAPAPPEPCVASATTMCLGAGGRFRVTAVWRTVAGDSGLGRRRDLTADTGSFWFFDQANVELIVKVLEACPVDGHRWVFAAGLTNVEVTLTVEDSATGARQEYRNPLGTPFRPVQDTAAFTCE